MTIAQQHLESRLWSAANALRGPVAHADFMTYMFPMLFWKWISDTWTWEHEQAVADFGDALNDEIEADNKALHQLATSVEVLATKQETIESNVNEIKTDVKALNALPASRWEGLIKTAVTTIVAALVGYALALAGLGG